MHPVFVITKETIITLLRSKIFYPTLLAYFFLVLVANIVSSWGILEFHKLLFDLGLFFFHFIGINIAILWSSEIIHQAQKEGYIEIHLASPLKRYQWVLGKYLGLFVSLNLMSLLIIIFWQVFMLINNFGWLGHQIILFFSQVLLILIAASMTLFFASFCGYMITIFLSYLVWFIGLINQILFDTLPQNIFWLSKIIILSLNKVWNLQVFNISYEALKENPNKFNELPWLILYASSLILIFISLSAFNFENKDI